MLRTQIAIESKNEETKRLTEYITMEQEKIFYLRKAMEEDVEKCDKMLLENELQLRQKIGEVNSAVQNKFRLGNKAE